MRLRIFYTVLCLSSLASGQQAASRLCVANFRNETTTKLELPKLRDMLVSQLKFTNLARNNRLAVVALNGDTDETVATEVRDNHCDFVSFQRVSAFRVVSPRPDPIPFPTIAPTKEKDPSPGIQFTVVSARNGIPILIDRRVSAKPLTRESDILPLLQAVSDRIQLELEKRLLGAKPAN